MPESAIANLGALYRTRFSPAEQAAKARIWQVLCDDFFSRFIGPEDTVLDLACGYGEFINAIRCRRRLAVDLNPDVASRLAPGVTFLQGSCERLGTIADGSVDVVFESNLFEHLPDKATLTRAVGEVRRVLRPGGRFILLQPNIRYVGNAYWDFYDHLIPLTDASCAELLVSVGFELERVIPRFLPYTTKSRLPQHPALVRWYLKVPPLWRVLGKQFLIVARR